MPRGRKNKLASVDEFGSLMRSAAGKGKDALVRIDMPRVAAASDGIPEAARLEPTGERGPDGRFLPGNVTSATGGRGKVGAIKLARQMGLRGDACAEFVKYERNAEDFRRHEVTRLAKVIGGGYCGAGPASIIAVAAMQRAASAYLFDRGKHDGDADLLLKASRLGNDSRQNLLAAHELCVREAKARGKSRKMTALGRIEARAAAQRDEEDDDQGTDGEEAIEAEGQKAAAEEGGAEAEV